MRDAITSGEFAISLSGAKLAATDYQSLCALDRSAFLDVLVGLIWLVLFVEAWLAVGCFSCVILKRSLYNHTTNSQRKGSAGSLGFVVQTRF